MATFLHNIRNAFEADKPAYPHQPNPPKPVSTPPPLQNSFPAAVRPTVSSSSRLAGIVDLSLVSATKPSLCGSRMGRSCGWRDKTLAIGKFVLYTSRCGRLRQPVNFNNAMGENMRYCKLKKYKLSAEARCNVPPHRNEGCLCATSP